MSLNFCAKLKKDMAHYAQAFVATVAQKNHTHLVHHSHKLLSKALLKQTILKNSCTGLTQEERGSFNRWNYVYAPHEPFRAMKKRATFLLQEMTKFGLVDTSMAAQEKAKAELDDEIKMFELWVGMFALCVQKCSADKRERGRVHGTTTSPFFNSVN